jgi:hypothetical protein
VQPEHVWVYVHVWSQRFVEELHKMSRDQWPHLVWCQEEVCPNTIRELGIDLPVLATIHQYADPHKAPLIVVLLSLSLLTSRPHYATLAATATTR